MPESERSFTEEQRVSLSNVTADWSVSEVILFPLLNCSRTKILVKT